MISLEKCKIIDSELKNLSDEEVVDIRDTFYRLGQLIFDDWLENKAISKYPIGVLQKLENSNKMEIWKKKE